MEQNVQKKNQNAWWEQYPKVFYNLWNAIAA